MERSPLPEPLRRRLTHFSHSLLSGSGSGGSAAAGAGSHFQPAVERQRCWIGQECTTSLPLQMCLYFNLYYFPFWWVSTVIMLEIKTHVLSVYYRIILCVILALISLVEFIRLYLGYIGNLQEKVPELAGFWLLTLLTADPMTLFDTCNPRLLVLPLEYGVNVIYLLLLGSEALLTFTALRYMVNQLELRFHMTHFDSLQEPQTHVDKRAGRQPEGLTGLSGFNWGRSA